MVKALYEYGMIIGESQIHVRSDREDAMLEAIKSIKYHRQQLIRYIQNDPLFQYTLKPIEIAPDAPEIIRAMTESCGIADVGPMASVAGSLADLGIKAMLKCGAKVAVIENGGEVAAFTERPVHITILSNNSPISGKIGFQITREDCPIGIATSSGEVGNAISFGEADSATVIANSASLADAASTAVCNAVIGENAEDSILLGLKRAGGIDGVRGALIIRKGHAGLIGRLPRIIKVKDG